MKKILFLWLFVAILLTGLAWLPYALVQQDLRQSANDPQIQMAEDGAASLDAGQSPQQITTSAKVDIARSLAPYIVVFDNAGNPIASSATLNGQIPTIPGGIFDEVRKNGEDRITWQPQSGVRSAIVVTQFKGGNGGFIMAGRSLREVELREENIQLITLLGWLVLLVISLLGIGIIFRGQLRFKRAQS